MYVGVPKNYGGTAFKSENGIKNAAKPTLPPILPHRPHHIPEKAECRGTEERCDKREECTSCQNEEKNPLSCLLHALRKGKAGGISTEDFLILGLIALLIGKEGNEDIVFILVMLLLL